MNILIVEDDEHIAHIQKLHLSFSGHNVQVVFNDFEKVLSQNWDHIDVIVCDYMLPGLLTGEDILRFFKEVYPDIRRVMISAIIFHSEKLKDVVDMFLAKPFCLLDLQVAVAGQSFKEADGGADVLRTEMHRDFWARIANKPS